MFKLLIADDEAGAREWLAREIPWEDHDLCIVGPAADGLEAWKLIQEEKPELILTDIRMPGMSGIELAQQVMKNFPNTRILVISGYDEFAYAKACLETGVSGYLLKPSPPEEILALVLKECEQLRQRQADDQVRALYELQLENSRPLLREQFLRELLQGEVQEEELTERLSFLQIETDCHYPVIALMAKVEDQAGFFFKYDEKERQLIWLAMYNLMVKAIAGQGIVGRLERGIVGAILFTNTNGSEGELIQSTDKLVRDLLVEARFELPCALQIGIGGLTQNLIKANYSFEQAKQALCLQSHFGVETIARHTATASDSNTATVLLQSDEERLSMSLETDQAVEVIHSTLQQLYQTKPGSDPVRVPELYRETGWVLTGMFVRVTQRAGLMVSQVIEEENYALLMQGGATGQPQQIMEWWEIQFSKLGKAIRGISHSSLRACIRQVKEYIDAHLAETISLPQVARSVYLSPSYLSRLFREQTNESFSEYVTRRKMEKARSLLGTGDQKVYEVAAAVGYVDPAYFGRVFRQYFNVTPMDYKKS